MEIEELLNRNNIVHTEAEVIDFENWLIQDLWKNYCEAYMEKAIIIKNKIDALNIHFPNGTAGKEYNMRFELPDDVKMDVEDFWFEGIDKIGLEDKSTADAIVFTGVPQEPDTFDFKLCYKYKGWIEGKPIFERKFTIAINPDPRTLWKDIPTPTDIEYYKSDSACDYVKVEAIDDAPQKDIVVASQRGRSHAHEGKARDDDFKVYYSQDTGWYIMAVADGAGSAKFSREGSRIACETVVNHCREQIASAQNDDFDSYIKMFKEEPENSASRQFISKEVYQIVGNAAYKAYKAIEKEAQIKSEPIKSYATTLLLTICKHFDFGWFIASYWVGDGALCIYNKEKQNFVLLGTPDEGEFSGQTRFLTMPEMFASGEAISSRLRMLCVEDFTALFMMTDGVSDPMFETDANLNSIHKWNELWDSINKEVELTDDNEASKDQLLKWLDFWSQGNHDDRTIAILY